MQMNRRLSRVQALMVWSAVFGTAASGVLALEKVNDWSIKGTIEPIKDEAPPNTEDVVLRFVRLYRFRKVSEDRDVYMAGIVIKFTPDWKFSLSQDKDSYAPNYISKCHYGLAALWKGRLANVEFDVTGDPFEKSDLVLKFGEASKNALAVRLISPEDGKTVPNVDVDLFLSPQSFSAPALKGFKVAQATSDAKGVVRAEQMPQGMIAICGQRFHPNGMTSLTAIPEGVFVDSDACYPTLPHDEYAKVTEDKLPIVYYVPMDMGLVWDALAPYLGGKPRLKAGTVLEFKAKQEERHNPKWNPNLTFQVTVGEKGLVKSPLVPRGIYTVRTVSGDSFTDDFFGISGILASRHKALDKWEKENK